MGVIQRGCLLFRLEAIVDMKGQNPFVWSVQILSNLFDIPGLVSVQRIARYT